jgi:hypothetical protein
MNQTNADLRRYYRVANKLYFQNKLPKINLYFKPMWRTSGRTALLNCAPAWIEINENLRPFAAITVMTVLHEMLHVEVPKAEGHGWRFDKRMLRLAKAGAFSGLW